MKAILPGFIASAALMAGACAQMSEVPAARAAGYAMVARYPVGGAGGWDYLSVDAKRHRLFVSRGDRVQILNISSGKVVGELPGTAGVHGIALADDLGVGFTSNGRSDSVTVFDLDSLAIVGTVGVTGSNPDAILYEPLSKRILTFNGRSANVTAIDAATRKVVGTIAVSGKPEFAVADGRGQVFVNIEDRNSLAAIDMGSLAVAHEWPLGSCDSPTGLAIDARRARLFSVCQNRRMIVIDAGTGRVLQELPIGAQVDGAEFDPQTGLAFSSNGDGTVTVVKADDAGRYAVVETVATEKRARTIALDPTTHRLYLPTASIAPESFVILVLGPKPDR